MACAMSAAIGNDETNSHSFDCLQNDRNNVVSRFQGSTSISSDDYFGDPNKKQDRSNYQGPDLATMKADFKEGVSKAAGRLSSLAGSVMSSIQVRVQSNDALDFGISDHFRHACVSL